MTSRARIVANRRNAQFNTGPRSVEAKARVSMNALKHGLRSTKALMPGESVKAFNAFRRDFFDDLKPCGPLEVALVERIVSNLWRLPRVGVIESQMLCHSQNAVAFLRSRGGYPVSHGSYSDEQTVIGAAYERSSESFARLSRYEISLERGVYKALHQLERLQAVRSGKEPCRRPAAEGRAAPDGGCFSFGYDTGDSSVGNAQHDQGHKSSVNRDRLTGAGVNLPQRQIGPGDSLVEAVCKPPKARLDRGHK